MVFNLVLKYVLQFVLKRFAFVVKLFLKSTGTPQNAYFPNETMKSVQLSREFRFPQTFSKYVLKIVLRSPRRSLPPCPPHFGPCPQQMRLIMRGQQIDILFTVQETRGADQRWKKYRTNKARHCVISSPRRDAIRTIRA